MLLISITRTQFHLQVFSKKRTSSYFFLSLFSFLLFQNISLSQPIPVQAQPHYHSPHSSTSSSSCVSHRRHCRYSTSADDPNEPLLCDDTVCSAFVTSAASLIPAITAESPSSRQASSTCSAASEFEFGSLTEAGSANANANVNAASAGNGNGSGGLASRPPRLHRRLFPSSSSSSQVFGLKKVVF